MQSVVNWILVISGCTMLVGWALVVLEILQNRLSTSKKWKDLTTDQIFLFVISLGGFAVFVTSLIVTLLLKP